MAETIQGSTLVMDLIALASFVVISWLIVWRGLPWVYSFVN